MKITISEETKQALAELQPRMESIISRERSANFMLGQLMSRHDDEHKAYKAGYAHGEKGQPKKTDHKDKGLKKNYDLGHKEGTESFKKLQKYKAFKEKEKADKLAAKSAPKAAPKAKAKGKIKEEIELDEARGRPPKEGSDAWKRKHGIAIEPTKRQAKKIAAANKARHANGVVHNDPADDDSDEGQYGKPRADYGNDVVPVITHLKKAMDNEKEHAEVPFSNGKKHKVPKHVAKAVHDGVMGLKPEMRGKVQDHIQKSHENLMQVHKIFTGS